MRSIFLNKNQSQIARVFSDEIIQRLKSISDLDGAVYSKEQILAHPDSFKDTEYIFTTWDMPEFSEDEIRLNLPSLKAVFYAAGSVQYFARPFLNCGVKVFSAWAANAVPVAEYTVAQIILANKGFFGSCPLMSSGQYDASRQIYWQHKGNYGATVGIIGAGMIGRLVIDMLKAYSIKVLVFDPFLPDEKAEALGVQKVELEELFSRCSVVSNHLANNKQTEGMLNYELFKLMPNNAVFLNTGRGAQVVEADLVRVLKERSDLIAILDVTFPEPPEKGHEFYALSNCLLTPHIAGSSGDEVNRMAEYMINEYEAFVQGKTCLYEVSPEMLKTMA